MYCFFECGCVCGGLQDIQRMVNILCSVSDFRTWISRPSAPRGDGCFPFGSLFPVTLLSCMGEGATQV